MNDQQRDQSAMDRLATLARTDDDHGSDETPSGGGVNLPRTTDSPDRPVPGGPRWYRQRIGKIGIAAGVVPMLVFGAISFGALAVSDSTASGLAGLLFGCAAAPVLLLLGAPFGDSDLYPIAIASSVPIWLALGRLAARRSSRRAVPSWGRYATELAALTVAVLVGAAIALGAASWWLGDGLLN